MLQIKKNDYFSNIFIFIALLVSPILALAPLGIWIPLILSAFILLAKSRDLLPSLKKNQLFKVLVIAFLWVLLSIFFIAKDLDDLEKFLYFFILVMAGLVLCQNISKISKFDKFIIVFSISFLLSTFLIILDLRFSLGLKLWLSKNFDSGNFINFYKFKNWTNFTDFRNQESNLIITYLKSSYDRGIIALTILALPLCLICYYYKYKVLAFSIIIASLFLALLSSNLTIILNYFVAVPLAFFYYCKKNIFKKHFFFMLATYFILSPFILGYFDYKNYSYYETTLLKKAFSYSKKYCGNGSDNKMYMYYDNFNIYLKCWKQDINYKKIKYNENFNLEKKSEKILIFFKHKMYLIASQKIHRLIIWSYTKEKIMEKPFLGHGFYSSRDMSQEIKQTERGTNYQFIPLHPHNSILQIWLELGIFGIIIFLMFIKILLNKIYNLKTINSLAPTIIVFSFLQIFVTSQIAYGFWQSWWIAIIIINFILYSFLFSSIRTNETQLN